jgi:hypothetical protein
MFQKPTVSAATSKFVLPEAVPAVTLAVPPLGKEFRSGSIVSWGGIWFGNSSDFRRHWVRLKPAAMRATPATTFDVEKKFIKTSLGYYPVRIL